MRDAPRIVYTPHPEATPESEAAALSAVYRFVLFDRMRAPKETGVRSPQSDSKRAVSDEPLRK